MDAGRDAVLHGLRARQRFHRQAQRRELGADDRRRLRRERRLRYLHRNLRRALIVQELELGLRTANAAFAIYLRLQCEEGGVSGRARKRETAGQRQHHRDDEGVGGRRRGERREPEPQHDGERNGASHMHVANSFDGTPEQSEDFLRSCANAPPHGNEKGIGRRDQVGTHVGQSHPRARRCARRLRSRQRAASARSGTLSPIPFAQPRTRRRRRHHGVHARRHRHGQRHAATLPRTLHPRFDFRGAARRQRRRALAPGRRHSVFDQLGAAATGMAPRLRDRGARPGMGHR